MLKHEARVCVYVCVCVRVCRCDKNEHSSCYDAPHSSHCPTASMPIIIFDKRDFPLSQRCCVMRGFAEENRGHKARVDGQSLECA